MYWAVGRPKTYVRSYDYSSTNGEIARTTPSADGLHGNIVWHVLPPFERTRKLRGLLTGGLHLFTCRALLASFSGHSRGT